MLGAAFWACSGFVFWAVTDFDIQHEQVTQNINFLINLEVLDVAESVGCDSLYVEGLDTNL